MPHHIASADRYDVDEKWFRRCGRSGLMLPALALGCWHNFGDPGTDAAQHAHETDMHENCQRMLFTAFDLGITHFDLANNYGPPPGAAETRLGRILKQDLRPYRNEMIISSKAGYLMWPGPYGDHGSRKYLIASCHDSLRRLQLDYVDIFYHHRPDNHTPLEETLGALDHLVRSGKALYVGISNYPGERTAEVIRVCERENFVKPIIHQPSYSMLNRWIEPDLLPTTDQAGMGVIAFCPLAQGQLTDKYLKGIPDDSRAASKAGFLKRENIKPQTLAKIQKLNDLAVARGQTLAQMALAWTLRDRRVTTALIGASRPGQIKENVRALDNPNFTADELGNIDHILAAD